VIKRWVTEERGNGKQTEHGMRGIFIGFDSTKKGFLFYMPGKYATRRLKYSITQTLTDMRLKRGTMVSSMMHVNWPLNRWLLTASIMMPPQDPDERLAHISPTQNTRTLQ